MKKKYRNQRKKKKFKGVQKNEFVKNLRNQLYKKHKYSIV